MSSDEVFDEWNAEKKMIHHLKNLDNYYVNEREIWFVKMGKNIGFEENGKKQFLRPVLVIKKVGNLFFTVALTSKGKPSMFYHRCEQIQLHNPKYQNSSFIVLSQVKVMDKKRFFQHAGVISQVEYAIVTKKLRTILF